MIVPSWRYLIEPIDFVSVFENKAFVRCAFMLPECGQPNIQLVGDLCAVQSRSQGIKRG